MSKFYNLLLLFFCASVTACNSSVSDKSGKVHVQTAEGTRSVFEYKMANAHDDVIEASPFMARISESSSRVVILFPDKLTVYDLATESFIWSQPVNLISNIPGLFNISEINDTVAVRTVDGISSYRLSSGQPLNQINYDVNKTFIAYNEVKPFSKINELVYFSGLYSNVVITTWDKLTKDFQFYTPSGGPSPKISCPNCPTSNTMFSNSRKSIFLEGVTNSISNSKVYTGVNLETMEPKTITVTKPDNTDLVSTRFWDSKMPLLIKNDKNTSTELFNFIDLDTASISSAAVQTFVSDHLGVVQENFNDGKNFRKKISYYFTGDMNAPLATIEMDSNAGGWTYYNESNSTLYIFISDYEKSFNCIYNSKTKKLRTWTDQRSNHFGQSNKMLDLAIQAQNPAMVPGHLIVDDTMKILFNEQTLKQVSEFYGPGKIMSASEKGVLTVNYGQRDYDGKVWTESRDVSYFEMSGKLKWTKNFKFKSNNSSGFFFTNVASIGNDKALILITEKYRVPTIDNPKGIKDVMKVETLQLVDTETGNELIDPKLDPIRSLELTPNWANLVELDSRAYLMTRSGLWQIDGSGK